jgi:hypothetical protein
VLSLVAQQDARVVVLVACLVRDPEMLLMSL